MRGVRRLKAGVRRVKASSPISTQTKPFLKIKASSLTMAEAYSPFPSKPPRLQPATARLLHHRATAPSCGQLAGGVNRR